MNLNAIALRPGLPMVAMAARAAVQMARDKIQFHGALGTQRSVNFDPDGSADLIAVVR
jgi:hypothetical protein